MSLHAQLSPEAQQKLHAQRRNSTLSSIAISILFIVLMSLVLGLFLLPQIIKETPVVVVYEAADAEEPTENQKVQKTIDKKPTPTSVSVAKVITSASQANVAIPVPDVAFSPPSIGTSGPISSQQGPECATPWRSSSAQLAAASSTMKAILKRPR